MSEKKHNPADTTLRNARASKKRDDVLAARVEALEQRIAVVEHWLKVRLPPPDAEPEPVK
jgi:hypothetical protein